MTWPRLGEDVREAAAAALGIPELEFFLSRDFGSTHSGFRARIRETLAARFPEEAVRMRDLNSPPRHSEYSISISHGHEYGGVAITPRPWRIGFDLEESSRVTTKIAERMRAEGDAPAPTPAHLWVAKEASFKCQFLGHQPTTSTQMVVQEWTPIAPEKFLFRASPPDSGTDPAGYGVVLEHRLHLMCFFTNRSQLRSGAAR